MSSDYHPPTPKTSFGRASSAWSDEETMAFLNAIYQTKDPSFDYYTGAAAITRLAYNVINWPDITSIRSEAACATRIWTLRRAIDADKHSFAGPVKNFIMRFVREVFFQPSKLRTKQPESKRLPPPPSNLMGVVKPGIHEHDFQYQPQFVEMRPNGGFHPPQKTVKRSAKHVYEHKPTYEPSHPMPNEDDIIINPPKLRTSGAKPADQDYWNMDAVKKHHLELMTGAPDHVKMMVSSIEKTDLYLKKWMDVLRAREMTVTVRQRVIDHHIGVASGLSPAEAEVYNYGGHDVALQEAKSAVSEAQSYIEFYARQRDCLWVAVEVQMNRRPCHQGYHSVSKLPIGFMRQKGISPFPSPSSSSPKPQPAMTKVSTPPPSLMSLISVLPSSSSSPSTPVQQPPVTPPTHRSSVTMPKPPSAPSHSSSSFAAKVFQSNGPAKRVDSSKSVQPVRPFDTSRSALVVDDQTTRVTLPPIDLDESTTSSHSSASSAKSNKRRHEELALTRSSEMDVSYSGSSASSSPKSATQQDYASSGSMKRVKLEEEATPHSVVELVIPNDASSPRLVAASHRVSIMPKGASDKRSIVTDKRSLVTYIIQLDVADEQSFELVKPESTQLTVKETLAETVPSEESNDDHMNPSTPKDDNTNPPIEKVLTPQAARVDEEVEQPVQPTDIPLAYNPLEPDMPTNQVMDVVKEVEPTIVAQQADTHSSVDLQDTFQIKVFELTKDGRTRRPTMISPMLLEVLLLTNVPLHMIDSIQPVYPEPESNVCQSKGAAHAFIITLSKTATGVPRSKRDFIDEFGSELIAPHYPSLSSQIFNHWQPI